VSVLQSVGPCDLQRQNGVRRVEQANVGEVKQDEEMSSLFRAAFVSSHTVTICYYSLNPKLVNMSHL